MIFHKKSGFTLIELLIVIAIIGILASVIAVSTNNARLKSRNSKRTTEVRQVLIAFNLYFNETGSFPGTATNYYCVSKSCYGTWALYDSNRFDPILVPKYLPALPEDLTGGRKINGKPTGGFLLYKNGPTPIQGEKGVIGAGDVVLNYLLEHPGKCDAGFMMSHKSGEYIECVVPLN